MARNASDVRALIASMTLEEKASLLSGKDFWNTKAIPRLGIESWMMTDGPHGMRKQTSSAEMVGLTESVSATCFPSGAGFASTWNPELVAEMGRAMGIEARAEGVRALLGPAVNIKRSPLCGRNFEYLSEDPFLAGEIAKAHIRGMQSVGVGASIKHFAANNQEKFRMAVDAIVDERTLREIYLPAFERAIRDARPWTVMCAYNKLNGTYCSQHPWLLTKVLRDEWGYEGVLVTDWTACDDRVAGLVAGQDLEMPGNGGVNDRLVVEAVLGGTLEEGYLDRAVGRSLVLLEKATEDLPCPHFDPDAHHALARRVAAEAAVLLKNESDVLPLAPGQRIALIGEFARRPRYQGSGSSHIRPTRLSSLAETLGEAFPDLAYASGYRVESDEPDRDLIDEAVRAARSVEVAVVCAGLTDIYESEGFDRTHLRIPASHVALIEAVAAVNPRTVVVLSNGAPVEMPWAPRVKAILETYLAGQAGAEAIADLLTGKANPSGKLAETFPLRLEDTPCFLNFPGTSARVEYREGVFVGYRHYDSVRRDVLFPFGHGLSYANFEYGDLTVSGSIEPDGTGAVIVACTIRNAGKVSGKETAQVYVSPMKNEIPRPEQELKGFAKVSLEPGESTRVSVTLDARAFSWYDVDSASWRVTPGSYGIRVSASSRDVRLFGEIELKGSARPKRQWSRTDTLSEVMRYPEFAKDANDTLSFIREKFANATEPGSAEELMMETMFREMPLRGLTQFAGAEGARFLANLLERLNA